ncbi:MAG: glycogen/starch synthase [Bacteroidia bacterium]|nr:glycogen/starch synthase [Bacteroidia bacterium]
MDKLKILFVTAEIDPFLKVSSAAEFVRLLPQKLQEKGHEIRILMPKFGVINERRNRLHEVVRLSGINIKIGDEEKPLTIKVASIQSAKLQVYFLDNEDYFQRKSVLTDPENNHFYDDNDERAIFFCKGAIETVKKLGWAPDIIHCHDWMTSFIPLYLRTHYKDDPMFKHTKVVFTLYNNGFEGPLAKNFLAKANIDSGSDNPMENYEPSYIGVCKGGISLADVVTKGSPRIDQKLEDYISSSEKEDLYFDTNDSDSYVESYQNLYASILN